MDNTKDLQYRHQTEEESGHGHGQAGGGEEGDAEEGQDDGDDEAQREVVFCLRCLPRSTVKETMDRESGCEEQGVTEERIGELAVMANGTNWRSWSRRMSRMLS